MHEEVIDSVVLTDTEVGYTIQFKFCSIETGKPKMETLNWIDGEKIKRFEDFQTLVQQRCDFLPLLEENQSPEAAQAAWEQIRRV